MLTLETNASKLTVEERFLFNITSTETIDIKQASNLLQTLNDEAYIEFALTTKGTHSLNDFLECFIPLIDLANELSKPRIRAI